MKCPNCHTEMMETSDLIDSDGLDYQEFPSFFWCHACGSFVDKHWKNGATIYTPNGTDSNTIEIPAERLEILGE